jgi:hypothetical protein
MPKSLRFVKPDSAAISWHGVVRLLVLGHRRVRAVPVAVVRLRPAQMGPEEVVGVPPSRDALALREAAVLPSM